jgi:hypothetical protein
MDKKKILIVSFSFFPRISPRSFRATELAKQFAKQGHSVTVLTHKRNHDYSEFERKYYLKVEDFVKGRWKEIQANDILTKAVRFFLRYFFLFPNIQLVSFLKRELQYYSSYDLLISIAVPYPVHWGVALASIKNKKLFKTWVADCGDPFMGNKELKFDHPFYFHFVEKWFCNKPDYITVPIDEAIQAYPASCRKRIRVIPQGFNFDECKNYTTPVNSIPTFAYAGALNKDFRDPSKFLQYISSLDSPFKFIVYTKSVSVLLPFTSVLGDKIEIRDYIPREQLLKELSSMDFLINFENKSNVQSPSKLIDYSLTNRPILSINAALLNTNFVDEFLKRNYTNQTKIKNIERYDIKNVASQFLKLIK